MRRRLRILFRILYVARFRTFAFSHFALYTCPSHGHLVTRQHCTKLWVGAQNSMGMQILRVITNVQNLDAPALRGDMGKCFFNPSSLKILLSNFHILLTIQPTNGKNIGKSLVAFSRKFHLKIAKFQILPILSLGDFKAMFNCKFK